MTDHDDVQHRHHHQPAPDAISVRDKNEDGVFRVRMPIVTTGEVRNEDDDPLTREEIDGMRRQIAEDTVGVFLDHGGSSIGGSGGLFGNRYSAIGKLGEWEDPELQERDANDEYQVVADAVLMDPDTLPEGAAGVSQALTALKAQAERDMALSASVGWRDDESYPGDVDLMEVSIVGIPADPRTTSQNVTPATAMARAAVDAGADPETFVDEVRAAVMGPQHTSQDDDSMSNTTDDSTDTDDERAEGDVELADHAEVFASHVEGMDPGDAMDAVPEDGDYVGSLQVTEYAAPLADRYDTSQGEMVDRIEGDSGDNEDESETDDENEGDHGDEDEDDEGDQGADGPDDTSGADDYGSDRDLEQEVQKLREQLAEVRSEGAVGSPGESTDDEDDGDERDTEEQPADQTADPRNLL